LKTPLLWLRLLLLPKPRGRIHRLKAVLVQESEQISEQIRCCVRRLNLHVKSPLANRGILADLTNAVHPALQSTTSVTKVLAPSYTFSQGIQSGFATHKTPMLIATATPIFSFLFICKFQTIDQGSKASRMSITPE
jgi:hypothetical protein